MVRALATSSVLWPASSTMTRGDGIFSSKPRRTSPFKRRSTGLLHRTSYPNLHQANSSNGCIVSSTVMHRTRCSTSARNNREYAMRPGEWRSSRDDDVVVGRHQPPSSARVRDFMHYFEERYRFDGMGKATRIIAVAIAHHRFNYIHPFPDGNGRVSRLMSHAMGHAAGVGAHGLWSVSRGLARGLENPAEYKLMMISRIRRVKATSMVAATFRTAHRPSSCCGSFASVSIKSGS